MTAWRTEEIDDTAATPPTRDAGFSLTESIIAVALMAVAVVPILLAAGLTVRTSSQSRSLTRVETVLANAADRVNRAPEGCDYTVYVQAAALAEGWQSSQTSVSYQYYEPGATATAGGTWKSGACPSGVRSTGLVQMVTISLTAPDGMTVRTVQVVKSDV
jgi:prepilin-type N-terminal cleavage/methylation domain-containing protein